jgi:hypothetical protein
MPRQTVHVIGQDGKLQFHAKYKYVLSFILYFLHLTYAHQHYTTYINRHN